MNLLVQMVQAVALQNTTTTLLMCIHKQSFELIANAEEKVFDIETKKKNINVVSLFSFENQLYV